MPETKCKAHDIVRQYLSKDAADLLDELDGYGDTCTLERVAENADELQDELHEIADGNVPVYNGQLLDWIGEDLRNASYIEDAMQEMGKPDNFWQLLMSGRYMYEIEKANKSIAEIRRAIEVLECSECGATGADAMPCINDEKCNAK